MRLGYQLRCRARPCVASRYLLRFHFPYVGNLVDNHDQIRYSSAQRVRRTLLAYLHNLRLYNSPSGSKWRRYHRFPYLLPLSNLILIRSAQFHRVCPWLVSHLPLKRLQVSRAGTKLSPPPQKNHQEYALMFSQLLPHIIHKASLVLTHV